MQHISMLSPESCVCGFVHVVMMHDVSGKHSKNIKPSVHVMFCYIANQSLETFGSNQGQGVVTMVT